MRAHQRATRQTVLGQRPTLRLESSAAISSFAFFSGGAGEFIGCDPAGHLQECFLGIPRKCPGECPRECLENWECPRECSESAFSHSFPRKSALGSTPWDTPNCPGTLGGTFWEFPKSTPKALAGALSGDSPKSTPVNGRQDRNLLAQERSDNQSVLERCAKGGVLQLCRLLFA